MCQCLRLALGGHANGCLAVSFMAKIITRISIARRISEHDVKVT